MKLSKIRATILIFTLLLSSGSYALGRSGYDVGAAIVQSRCEAGAFITHANTPSTVDADAYSDESVSLANVSNQIASVGYSPISISLNNLIPNGNLAVMDGALPKGWYNNIYGHNNGRFSLAPGYQSPNALRIDISSYTSGTADWFTPVMQVQPGGYYQYSDYYRSNVTTRPVLILIDNSGKSQYINLDSIPASTSWALDTQRFFVPSNISRIMMTRPLDRTGWLETDDYQLQSAVQPGFDQAAVSLTFDDGWRSIYDNALPLLKKYNFVSTQYIVSGFLGSIKAYMTPKDVHSFVASGNEIASHTLDHPDLTKLSPTELDRQLKLSHDGLSKCFGSNTDFAPPYGANNSKTIAAEKPFYATSRSTEVGYNSPDTFNPYELKVQNIRADTTAEQVKAWVATAKTNHVWLILVYHQVATTAGEYTRSPANFASDLSIIKDSRVAVKTVHDAYASYQSQATAK